jgi:Tol biopolymer transport system component
VTVSAPPEVPKRSPVEEPLDRDAQEALIEEARRRTRRRRMRYAASVLAVGVIALSVFGFGHGWGRGAGHGESSPAASAPNTRLPAAANGVLAIEVRRAGGVINADTLAVINPDGSGLRPLTRCSCGIGTYAWSPDGKRLGFLSGRFGGAIKRSNLSLFVVNADGTGTRLLAHCGVCGSFSWSPDSRRIVYTFTLVPGTSSLRIVDVRTGAQRRLGVSGVDPVWSPTGARIVFGWDALYSIRPDGSGKTSLVSSAGGVAHPAWSPDGRKVAFDTADDRMYVVDADGSHLRLLQAGAPDSGPDFPSWSPRGDRLLFLSSPESAGGVRAEVWVMKPDGSGLRRLYRSPADEFWSPPIWSPNGKAIAIGMSAFVTNRFNSNGILVMDPQGNHRRRLLGNPNAIAWQPIPRTR